MELLNVSMLGSFRLTLNGQELDDNSNRMKKVWLLLAYLIYSRKNRLTQEQFVSLIQGSDVGQVDDPASRLKALFYRARTMLDQLGDQAGKEYIVHKNGTYCWNTDYPIQLDVEEFEKLCRAAENAEGAEQLSLYLQAMDLYRGDFLPKLAMEPWVMPINAYYHRLYLSAALKTLSLLLEQGRHQEGAALCSSALRIEPYSEELCQYLIRFRIALDDRAGARKVYEEMSEALFEQFGVMPSDESRLLYREACREVKDQAVPVDSVREDLKEAEKAKGAVFCEYDFFRMLYQVQARAIIRSGEVVHIALLSVHGGRKALPRRSLDTAMDNLQALLLQNLRQGDVVTRCSISQMIVMLPSANYENSCAVCQRIIKAFERQYPHTPAYIRYSVQPLEPAAAEPRV